MLKPVVILVDELVSYPLIRVSLLRHHRYYENPYVVQKPPDPVPEVHRSDSPMAVVVVDRDVDGTMDVLHDGPVVIVLDDDVVATMTTTTTTVVVVVHPGR
jgi:hypothetical protein